MKLRLIVLPPGAPRHMKTGTETLNVIWPDRCADGPSVGTVTLGLINQPFPNQEQQNEVTHF